MQASQTHTSSAPSCRSILPVFSPHPSVPVPVSLLIPCFQSARDLPNVVEAARAQTTPFAEILVYDDASTDGTAEVARSLGLAVEIGADHLGMGHACNRLVAQAKADWVHVHEPGVELSTAFVSELQVACSARHDVMLSPDAPLDSERHRTQLSPEPTPAPLDLVERWLVQGAPMSTAVFNRDRWLVMGGCDPRLSAWSAADLLIRLALDGAAFTTMPSRQVGESPPRATGRDRLLFLEKQASDPRLARFRPVLAALAESTAVASIEERDLSAAAAAVRLAQRLGSRPPSSRRPAWSLLRPWVPGLALLRLQTWWRRTRSDRREAGPVETA